jgi:hypothetical protein
MPMKKQEQQPARPMMRLASQPHLVCVSGLQYISISIDVDIVVTLDVVILSGVRTPIGKSQGALSDFRATEAGAIVPRVLGVLVYEKDRRPVSRWRNAVALVVER